MKSFQKKLFAFTGFIFLFAFAYSQEALRIEWPDEYRWKKVLDQENEEIRVIEIIPEKDSVDNWTILGQMLCIKNMPDADVKKVSDMIFQEIKKSSPEAKMKIVEYQPDDQYPWIIFTIESPQYEDTGTPESQVWYFRQGLQSFYMNFVAVKQKKLSKKFVKKMEENIQQCPDCPIIKQSASLPHNTFHP